MAKIQISKIHQKFKNILIITKVGQFWDLVTRKLSWKFEVNTLNGLGGVRNTRKWHGQRHGRCLRTSAWHNLTWPKNPSPTFHLTPASLRWASNKWLTLQRTQVHPNIHFEIKGISNSEGGKAAFMHKCMNAALPPSLYNCICFPTSPNLTWPNKTSPSYHITPAGSLI